MNGFLPFYVQSSTYHLTITLTFAIENKFKSKK